MINEFVIFVWMGIIIFLWGIRIFLYFFFLILVMKDGFVLFVVEIVIRFYELK